MLLKRDNSCLIIIDVQERLISAMSEADAVVANTGVLLKAAERLGIPVLFSEQYPKGLGPTVAALAPYAAKAGPVTKTDFSCATAPGFVERLRATGREQAVLAGIEAHVCVLQTALGLRQLGFPVFVVADAISSRKAASAALALDRMRAAGVSVVTTEMVIFEWLARAGSSEFKELSALVK
jgi:nicotinamidase-related amidase